MDALLRQKKAYDLIAGHLDEIGMIISQMSSRSIAPTLEERLKELREGDEALTQFQSMPKRDVDLLIAGGINVIERLFALRQALDMAGWGLGMIAPEMYEERQS